MKDADRSKTLAGEPKDIELAFSALCPHHCPPSDADDTGGPVYRFVNADPPVADDFRSHRERWPMKVFPDMCDACGLSVFITEADARHAQGLVPGMYKKQIALGNLSPGMGKIKDTSQNTVGHHTWWLPLGVPTVSIVSCDSLDREASNVFRRKYSRPW